MEAVSSEFHTDTQTTDACQPSNTASDERSDWAASDKMGRVPNAWIDDIRITADVLAILQFMATHPGWKLMRAYMCRSQPKGGPGWSTPRYIEARLLMMELGLLDPETRKLILPANMTSNWTPAVRGEARAALYARKRGTKSAVVALYLRRFKTAPTRAEIRKRFKLSPSTLQRIDRSKSNTPHQSKSNRSTPSKSNTSPSQNRTPTANCCSTYDKERQETYFEQQQRFQYPGADAVRNGDATTAPLDRLIQPEALDRIAAVWRRLADVMPSDGSAEEAAMQAAVMTVMATDEHREIDEIVGELCRADWDCVRNPGGYARRAIEKIIMCRMTVHSRTVTRVIQALDERLATAPRTGAPVEDVPAPDVDAEQAFGSDPVADFGTPSDPDPEIGYEPETDTETVARGDDPGPQPEAGAFDADPVFEYTEAPHVAHYGSKWRPVLISDMVEPPTKTLANTDAAIDAYRVMIEAGVHRNIAAGMAVTFAREDIEIGPHLERMSRYFTNTAMFWKFVTRSVRRKAKRVSTSQSAREIVADFFDVVMTWEAEQRGVAA